MTSLGLKNKALKSNASSLSKEIGRLINKDEQQRLYDEILRTRNENYKHISIIWML